MIAISVIVPVYNVQNYLRDCIESLINQTFKDFELILVDDGSTDKSGLICDEYAQKDSRIKVYHKVNEGLGLTRKYGFERSTGQYVTFIDSDDSVLLNYLESLYFVADKNEADLVVSGYIKTDELGREIFTSVLKEESFSGSDVKNILLSRFIGSLPDKQDSIFTTAWGKLYLRNTLAVNHVEFYSERVIQSEDLAFQFDALPHFKSAYVIQYSGYKYRTNTSSLSLKYKPNRFDEVKKVYRYTLNKITELRLPADAKYRADKMLFVQILSCLKQENTSISKKNIYACLKRIKEIISDSLVQKVVRQYPIKKLNWKQKSYVLMIKYRMGLMLYFVCKMM